MVDVPKFKMDARSSLRKLIAYVEREHFKGYDPYDALNSPLMKFLSFKRKWLRIAVIQFLKKSPINFRPVLGIRKGLNPKGVGLFLWGYAKLFALEKNPGYRDKIEMLLDLLDEMKSSGYSGNGWGYNFDWQSRAFYVPKYTPTIVNSSFIGHALIDTYRLTGFEKALDLALPIKDFILNDLNRHEENGRICFSYTPLDKTCVHNANLLGASLLIRLYKYSGDEKLKTTAMSSLAYTMGYQKDDGSWPYAESGYQKWIDSFHTGFNLQCLSYFLEEGEGMEYQAAFEKGAAFYARDLFLEDGSPKYYHDRVYPLDIHSAAQAIVFFSRMGDSYKDLDDRILDYMIARFQDKKGYFYYQIKKHSTNKIPYMRWSQAWAFHALTSFLAREG
jgi:hypothetical protein